MSSALDHAEELLRKGRYSEAIERFRALLSADPDNAPLRGRVGEAYRLSGNHERAFHHFHKSAGMHTRRGEVRESFRMLEAANSVSPGEPDVLFRMAECLRILGPPARLELVLRQLAKSASASGDRRRLFALEELVAMYPDDQELAVQRARTLGEAGRVEEAVAAWKKVSAQLDRRGADFAPALREAATIASERPDLGVDLSRVLIVSQRPRDALSVLVPFYEKFPDDIGVLEALLEALEQLGATDKIVAARIELVKARSRVGQRSAALSEITTLLAAAPNDPAVLEVCAHACAVFGLKGEASRLWFQLALAYDSGRREAERDRVLLNLLKTNPNHQGALELGARVLETAGRVDEAQALKRRLYELRRTAREAEELDLPPAADAAQTAPPPQNRPPVEPPRAVWDPETTGGSDSPWATTSGELDAVSFDDESDDEEAPWTQDGEGDSAQWSGRPAPGGSPDRAGAQTAYTVANRPKPSPTRTMMLGDDDFIGESQLDGPTFDPDPPTLSPDALHVAASDLSNPEVEPMPIHRAPWSEDEQRGRVRAQTGVTRLAASAPPIEEEDPTGPLPGSWQRAVIGPRPNETFVPQTPVASAIFDPFFADTDADLGPGPLRGEETLAPDEITSRMDEVESERLRWMARETTIPPDGGLDAPSGSQGASRPQFGEEQPTSVDANLKRKLAARPRSQPSRRLVSDLLEEATRKKV